MGYCPFQSNFDGQIDCPQSTACQLWDSNKNECSAKLAGLYLYHIHDSHRHMIRHNVSNVPAGDGEPAPEDPPDPPFAATLVNEYVGNQDMDGDGKVYGFDFKIEDNSDKPPMLKGLESQPDWPDPSETMTWDEYMAFRS